MRNKKMFNGGDFQSGVYANGGGIGFIPMDLEESLRITAKWGGTNIKGVIGILNAMIDSGLTDEDLKPKPTKSGIAHQNAIEKKSKEIWTKIKPKYKGDLEGNMPYSTIRRLVDRANSSDDILKRFKPYRKNQKDSFADGGDFQSGVYAQGGSLQSHGIKLGDTFLKTLSGNIQKVKDSNGEIVYVNLSNGARDKQPPLPFDDGGEVTYYLNKDGVRVRSKVEPKEKLSEAEWMAKHNKSNESRTYGLGGLFGKAKQSLKSEKYPKLEGKQVSLKNGKMVQVFEQNGSQLSVLELGRMGTGERPHLINISEVSTTSFAGGGGLNLPKEGDMIKNTSNYGDRITKVNNGYVYWRDKYAKEQYCKISDLKLNNLDDDGDDDGYYEDDVNYWITSKPLGYKKGGALIGNQKRIDMNKNGKIDAEDFKLLRSSMNGAWRNERKHVNHNEDYEVRYAKPRPKRTGYKGKRKFEGGGGVSTAERFKKVLAKHNKSNQVKPKTQKQNVKTGATEKKGNRGGVMVLAKKIRKEGESWKDALKRAGQQLK